MMGNGGYPNLIAATLSTLSRSGWRMERLAGVVMSRSMKGFDLTHVSHAQVVRQRDAQHHLLLLRSL